MMYDLWSVHELYENQLIRPDQWLTARYHRQDIHAFIHTFNNYHRAARELPA